MQPIGVVIPRESYSGYGSLVAHKLHRFTAPIGHGMWLVSSIADQLYRLERSLIDTGEATPPQKQPQAYTSRCQVLLGSSGLKFYFFIIIFIIINIKSLGSSSFKVLYSRVSEALDFYRYWILSMAYVLHILVYQVSRNRIAVLPHASRYHHKSYNLMHRLK